MPEQFPITSSSTSTPPIKKYEENFGHLAEAIIRDCIGKKAGMVVEKVEKASEVEDKIKKVDFWIKFIGLDQPLGIQYTISDNENKIKYKKSVLKSFNNIVRREPRSDTEIQWFGNANVVLIHGNKEKMVNYWKEIEENKKSPAEVVGDEFLRDFFSQVFIELGEVNPAMKSIVFDAFKKAVEKVKKQGSKK